MVIVHSPWTMDGFFRSLRSLSTLFRKINRAPIVVHGPWTRDAPADMIRYCQDRGLVHASGVSDLDSSLRSVVAFLGTARWHASDECMRALKDVSAPFVPVQLPRAREGDRGKDAAFSLMEMGLALLCVGRLGERQSSGADGPSKPRPLDVSLVGCTCPIFATIAAARSGEITLRYENNCNYWQLQAAQRGDPSALSRVARCGDYRNDAAR